MGLKLKIHISGSGTPAQIAGSLKKIAFSLLEDEIDGVEWGNWSWEDPWLYAESGELDEIDEEE